MKNFGTNNVVKYPHLLVPSTQIEDSKCPRQRAIDLFKLLKPLPALEFLLFLIAVVKEGASLDRTMDGWPLALLYQASLCSIREDGHCGGRRPR